MDDTRLESYIARLRSTAINAFDELFEGISSVAFLDFPDHANVGDSAIALGSLAYMHERRIRVTRVSSIGTYRKEDVEGSSAVFMNGGGNLGGLYPIIDAHRYEVARDLPDATLIHGPQSAHFIDEAATAKYRATFSGRRNYRVGARDAETKAILESINVRPILSPDPVHILGRLDIPEPTQAVLIVRRRDGEARASGASISGLDWGVDPPFEKIVTKFRTRLRKLGPVGSTLSPSAAQWMRIARGRLWRGLELISPGRTVITDRLHVMLTALQAGRRVIAVDNSYGKVHGYARTWLQGDDVPLTLATNFAEALDFSHSLG